MIRPSRRSPRLPRGRSIDVAVASLADERSIRGALKGIDVIIHLAGAEWQGRNADLLAVDMQGTENLARAAADAGVERLITISHLGASRSSGYPVLKAKGVAEEHVRRSGVPYTIIRSALVFGPNDHFTTSLAGLLRASPLFFPLPMSSRTVIQPLWVEDLVTALMWSLDDAAAVNRTYEIGGSEFFTVRQIVETVMQASQTPRTLYELHPVLLRALIVSLEFLHPEFPGLFILARLHRRQPDMRGGESAALAWVDARALHLPLGLSPPHALVLGGLPWLVGADLGDYKEGHGEPSLIPALAEPSALTAQRSNVPFACRDICPH